LEKETLKMTRTGKHLTATALVSGLFALAAGQVFADLSVGDDATLFQSIDEDMEPVDMADMIDGKPLVLVVSSAS
jgi:hypothetical protein